MALRARVLELVEAGAGAGSAEADHHDEVISWTSGPVTTHFRVCGGPDDAPDLGVLAVVTPVAGFDDHAQALADCAALNTWATTSRWTVVPDEDGGIIQLSCSFVVSAESQYELAAFVACCVRDQVAAATKELTSAPAAEAEAEANAESETALETDATDLAVHLRAAFLKLGEEMRAEGTGTWYCADPESFPLIFEVPATWQRSPGGEIRFEAGEPGTVPTASVHASLTQWGHAGDGLLIGMVGVGYPAASEAAVNELNRLDEQARGATHFIGAWMWSQKFTDYTLFLPATLLSEPGINWPVVMREILLSFARQAQLARRVLFDERTLQMLDGGTVQPVGFEASRKPRGLAWGETGEGRNPAAWHLNGIYDQLVAGDGEWAYPAGHGFRWWPHDRAQQVSVENLGTRAGVDEVVRVRVTTEIRVGVPATDEALTAIARRNATLPESALVLRDDGVLLLASQLVIPFSRHATGPQTASSIAIRQFILARELSAEFSEADGDFGADLGSDAVSAHPVSGLRPVPDEWFKLHAENLKKHAADPMPESAPQVALIAAGGQYALPYRMTVGADGSLDFSWRPEHTPQQVPADPEVRVTMAPGPDQASPAWLIRSYFPVTGDETAKARWCNDRNAEILLSPQVAEIPVMTGGWGLAADGECFLTIAQARDLVRGEDGKAAIELGYLLREVQSIVLVALEAAPEMVHEVPLTAGELADGLNTVRDTVAEVFGESADLAWSVHAQSDDASPASGGVLVTCGSTTRWVPVGWGRAPLALTYGDLLAATPGGREWLQLYALFPGQMVSLAFERLEQEGLLWLNEAGECAFDAGQWQATLGTVEVGNSRRYGAMRTLQVFAEAGFLPAAGAAPGVNSSGLRRIGVTIPPAQFAWAIEPAAVDVLAWVMRDVIGQVRDAAVEAEEKAAAEEWRLQPAHQSSLGAGHRLFGGGRVAAAALRARLLALLGAEPDWLIGGHDSRQVIWNSGVATTLFEVADAADGTPDLGVLRVITPVASARNGNAARDLCLQLNAETGLTRWSVAREPDGAGQRYDEVQASCAFVVGAHSQDTLEGLALWCVREQIAVATGHILSGDLAKALGGRHMRYEGFPGGDDRPDRHPVTSFLEQVVQPGAALPELADTLAEGLLAAFRDLREAMFEEGVAAWYTMHDRVPLTFESPFSWELYPQGVVTTERSSDDDPRKPPTALVESVVTEHPSLGPGLRAAVHVPRDPRGHAGRAANALNLLDAKVPGSSQSIGGWTISRIIEPTYDSTGPGCEIFLPAAFASSVEYLPVALREILLTLARQALLARRVLVPREQQVAEDRADGIGLAAAADPLETRVRGPHGLAWGETGEGRNPAARVLDQIYDRCVGPDADWADVRPGGFTWWPYRQCQDVTATLLSSASGVVQGVCVRIATEVRRGVPASPQVLQAVAELNAELGQSALVLRADGLLILACRLYVHEGIDHWANKWAQMLAAEQFITARDVSARLAGLFPSGAAGEEAVSAHPFSGLRPAPDELFTIRESSLIGWANGVRVGLTRLVPLLGVGRPYPLLVSMSVTDAEDGLEFTWRPSQTHAELPADPVIRVSVQRGDVGSGPGWLIRSVMPVAGDTEHKARWCNDQNLALFGDREDSDDGTVVGGWGLTPDGDCCLTTWLSPYFVPDDIMTASGLVGNILSYHSSVVLPAIRAELVSNPGGASTHPLTPEEFAAELSSVLAAFCSLLEYPPDFRWTVEPGEADVTVTLTGPAGGVESVMLAEAADSGLRTVVRVPLARNRAALGVLYAAFLGRSSTRVRSFKDDLIPGEYAGWNFAWPVVDEGFGVLDEEGLLAWVKDRREFTFETDPAPAFLKVERLEGFRPHGGTALRLTATVPGLPPADGTADGGSDVGVLGTWSHGPHGLSYVVTIPPVGVLLGSDFAIRELVTWTARHMITRVQQSLVGHEPVSALVAHPGTGWHDHGDGTAAIMCGTDLVASFHVQYIDAEGYGKSEPPDRRAETQRSVDESAETRETDEKGGALRVDWVAAKWQVQLNAWYMYGEPVFWCDHVDEHADEQPLLEWFLRFPAAVMCDQCADRVREHLLTGDWPTACSSCGKEDVDTVYARTPGMSIIASYELCETCSAAFTA